MKRVILPAVIVAAVLTGSASAQNSKRKAMVEEEIRRLDLAHADAVLRGDRVAMDKLWTEDFIVNNHLTK